MTAHNTGSKILSRVCTTNCRDVLEIRDFQIFQREIRHGQNFGRIGLKFSGKVAQRVAPLFWKFEPPTYFTFPVVAGAANLKKSSSKNKTKNKNSKIFENFHNSRADERIDGNEGILAKIQNLGRKSAKKRVFFRARRVALRAARRAAPNSGPFGRFEPGGTRLARPEYLGLYI